VSLETLPENRERRCWGKVRRKTIPKIGGEDWEGPPADGSEIVGWHHKLIGIRWSKPQPGWHDGWLIDVQHDWPLSVRPTNSHQCSSSAPGPYVHQTPQQRRFGFSVFFNCQRLDILSNQSYGTSYHTVSMSSPVTSWSAVGTWNQDEVQRQTSYNNCVWIVSICARTTQHYCVQW